MGRDSGIRDLFGHIYGIGILAAIVSGIFKVHFLMAVAGVFALCFVGFAGVLAFSSIAGFVERSRRCAHGIRRGEEGGCRACSAEREQRAAESRAYQAAREAKKDIADRARLLRESELKELRRRWLSRAELYFEMSPKDFENGVADLFRELGYEVKQTPFSNDRGKDAIVWKDGRKYLVECKRYDNENTIGRRDLQVFVAAMKEENAEGGFYVNTGRFARTAIKYAAENDIELYDRDRFPILVNRAFPVSKDVSTIKVMCLQCGDVLALPVASIPAFGSCNNGHKVNSDVTVDLVLNVSLTPDPMCRLCGSRMRIVNGWRGKFWGCSKYPTCRYTARYQVAKMPKQSVELQRVPGREPSNASDELRDRPFPKLSPEQKERVLAEVKRLQNMDL